MKGNPEVIAYLNSLIGGELAARDQYFIHSRMYEDWGLTKIYERINHEMEEETTHADAIIRRVLFLGAEPDMTRDELNIGHDVVSCLKSDLELEYHVRDRLAQGIKLCEEKGDFISRDMLRQQLLDTEEDHMYWLEKQIDLIELIGLQNYIQSQM
ncbi:bacterioferritin [Moraxella sp. ZY210820]|uniref:heteropolymeric bacterioferritin subunit Ftn n=1 Tax=unclassified Moraxella TaxID=2685852 RepID=UPI002730850E|nr:bacterioferritin [Moraxella sp. ZY210820]WLF84895.1 bacterioferritin [Moraxella sp. ZY210820]